MREMLCDIVIVNWNSSDLLFGLIPQCLELIGVGSIIIVDNNSDKKNQANLKIISKLSDKIVIIENDKNLGFGAACNIGARETGEEFILFLNPDIQFVDNLILRNSMLEMIQAEASVLGVMQIDEHGEVHRSCARLPDLKMILGESSGLSRIFPKIFPSYFMSDWNHLDSRYVDHVIGSFYLIKRKNFVSIGGFDERFFVYYEDLDLSCRILKSGGKIYYSSNNKVIHEGGGTSKNVKSTRIYYSQVSRLKYSLKHFNKSAYMVYASFSVTLEYVIRIVYFVIHRDIQAVNENISAYKKYIKYIASGRL